MAMKAMKASTDNEEPTATKASTTKLAMKASTTAMKASPKKPLAMKASMEPLFASHGVDIAFAGHVHAYERCFKTLNNKTVEVGPDPGTVYVK